VTGGENYGRIPKEHLRKTKGTVCDFTNIGFIGSRSLLGWGANYRFMGT